MLDYLGEKESSERIIKSIEKTLSEQSNRTADLGGKCSTTEAGDAILKNL